MSDEKTFPTRTPDLFAEDSPASPSATQGSSEHRTTPATSGRKCLDLSGNVGPLGLLEKTLLDSSNWAWTKYSLTWKAKATPQGRLIFQLARLAPRTSAKGSGLLHTPTAKANQTSPSMAKKGKGNWVSGLWQTPMADDARGGGSMKSNHIKLHQQVKLWPTPRKSMANGPTSREVNSGKTKGRLENAVQLWPTPRAEKVTDEKEETWRKRQRKGDVSTPPLSLAVKMWPTRTQRDGKGGYQGGRIRNGKISRDTLDVTVQHTDNQEKTGGQLNPTWVAWLMGYPTEYLSCVPWETPSSRRSQRK